MGHSRIPLVQSERERNNVNGYGLLSHVFFFCHHPCVHASLYLTVHVLATNAAGPERELDDIGHWMPIRVEDSLSRAGVDVLERE